MSTGKRLAKRSILGTRVACMMEDGKYYPSIICAVKSLDEGGLIKSVGGVGMSPILYTVRVEGEHRRREVRESDLVGSGFVNVNCVKLRAGQKVYITHNNREIHGAVLYHRPNIDEVLISVINPETNVKSDVKKRLEDIRLMESRKSARLADSDTDFAKLADMNTDRKERKQSQGIDVPITQGLSRKRRSSRPEDEEHMEGERVEGLNECSAAMVLMKLSCSPRSPVAMPPDGGMGLSESAASSVSSGVWSWAGGSISSRSPQHRSATPSPPLSESSPGATTDDGLDLDDSLFDDNTVVPRKRRSSTRTMFKCTWVGCPEMTSSCEAIESHIRLQHLGRGERSDTVSEQSEHSESDSDSDDDHEEEFYWTEIEVNVATWVDPCEPLGPPLAALSPPPPPLPQPTMAPLTLTSPTPAIPLPTAVSGQSFFAPAFSSFASPPQYIQVSSPPTLSHMDMARPPHEDPEYRRQFGHSAATLSSSWPRTSAYLSSSRGKVRVSSSPKASPGRGKRNGESRKCRKVYGMEQRDMWCTQCKWKKACSRFGE